MSQYCKSEALALIFLPYEHVTSLTLFYKGLPPIFLNHPSPSLLSPLSILSRKCHDISTLLDVVPHPEAFLIIFHFHQECYCPTPLYLQTELRPFNPIFFPFFKSKNSEHLNTSKYTFVCTLKGSTCHRL